MSCCTPKILSVAGGGTNPIQINSIDLIQDPANSDILTVVLVWTDENGNQQVTADATPVTIIHPAGADGVITDVAVVGGDLQFTGQDGGFNGSIPLSDLVDFTNLTQAQKDTLEPLEDGFGNLLGYIIPV